MENPVGAAFARFIVMSVGSVPAVKVNWLFGFPKLSVLGVLVKPVRLTLPVTSNPPVEVLVLGCVKVLAPRFRSPEVSANTPVTVVLPPSVTPDALPIVKLPKLNAPPLPANDPPTVDVPVAVRLPPLFTVRVWP